MAASDYDGRLPEPPYDTDTSAAVALQEECDRLSDQVAELQNERDVLRSILAENLQAWDGEEESVREEHEALIEETRDAVEAEKFADPREQVKLLRETLLGVLESSEDGGGMNDIDWGGIRAALEATKEGA